MVLSLPERLVLAALAAAWIAPAWWLGASTVAGQTIAALAGAAALALALRARRRPAGRPGVEASDTGPANSGPFAVFCIVAFLALLLSQALNPDRQLVPDRSWVGHLAPLDHLRWLPTGLAQPFDRPPGGLLLFSNAWRFLLVAAGAVLPLAALVLLPRRTAVGRALLGLLFAHAVLFSTFAFAHNLSGSKAVLWFVTDANFHLGAPQFPFKNQQAAYQLLLLALSLALWFLPADLRPWPALRHRARWLGLGTTLVFLGTVTTRSRFGLGAALLLSLFAAGLALWPHRRRPELLRGGALGAGVVLLSLLLLPPVRATALRLGELARDPGSLLAGGSFRKILHQIAWRMALDRPWFGHGAGCYLPLFPEYQARVPAYMEAIRRDHPDTNRPVHAHADGDWAEFTAEFGLIGTALFAAPWLVWLGTLRRRWPLGAAPLLCAAGTLLVLVHGWVDFVLRNGAILGLAGVLALLALGLARSVASEPPPPAAP